MTALAGCSASANPAPTAKTSEISSKEDAAAAAIATLEQYIQATNQIDYGEAESAEAIYVWLTGDALAAERESITTATAELRERSGTAEVSLSAVDRVSLDPLSVELNACVDVSDVEVVDSSGESLVAEDRVDVQPVWVRTTASANTETGLVIEEIEGREGEPSCDT